MIKGCIICDEMHFINGANKVAEKIASNYNYFLSKEIEIVKIYTQDQVIPCNGYISPLGDNLNRADYVGKRATIDKLKKSRVYRTKPVQCYLENKNILSSKKAIETFKSENETYDFILFNSINCAYFYLTDESIKKKIPTIIISHVASDPMEQLLIDRPEIKGTRIEKKTYEIYEYVVKNISRVISICNMSYDYILSNYDVTSKLITNGVEDIEYHVPEEGYDYSSKDKLRFVCIASVTNRKGQDLIVKAVSNLPDNYKSKVQVNIVGLGNEYNKVSDMISSLGLSENIHMLGARNDVADILKANDIFILPSRADTVPVSILEALRAGMPIISTKVGEVPEMVGEAGLIIETNEDAVKKAIMYCVDNRDKLKEFSKASRIQYEKKYSIETMLSLYSNAIFDIVGKEKQS